MFGFLKKKVKKNNAGDTKNNSKITLKIDGMHCSSCGMNIDGELEDLDGVIYARTIYAKQTSLVKYDESKVSETKIKKVVEELGYKLK